MVKHEIRWHVKQSEHLGLSVRALVEEEHFGGSDALEVFEADLGREELILAVGAEENRNVALVDLIDDRRGRTAVAELDQSGNVLVVDEFDLGVDELLRRMADEFGNGDEKLNCIFGGAFTWEQTFGEIEPAAHRRDGLDARIASGKDGEARAVAHAGKAHGRGIDVPFFAVRVENVVENGSDVPTILGTSNVDLPSGKVPTASFVFDRRISSF